MTMTMRDNMKQSTKIDTYGDDKMHLTPNSKTEIDEEATPEEIERLDALLKKESTHFQWSKHGICLVLLISNVMVSLLRGSKKSKSIIGI